MKGSGHSSPEVAKSLVRRMNEAVNGNDLDAMDAVVASGYRHRVPGHALTLGELKELNREFYAAFPDVNWEIKELVAEGDVVVAFWQFHGTQRGEFMGRTPNGKPVTLNGVNRFEIADGKIAHDTPWWDLASLLNQLGPS